MTGVQRGSCSTGIFSTLVVCLFRLTMGTRTKTSRTRTVSTASGLLLVCVFMPRVTKPGDLFYCNMFHTFGSGELGLIGLKLPEKVGEPSGNGLRKVVLRTERSPDGCLEPR
jgi:hypothetical protein